MEDYSEYELSSLKKSPSLVAPHSATFILKKSLSQKDEGISIALAINNRWDFQGKCEKVYGPYVKRESDKAVIYFKFDEPNSALTFAKNYKITITEGSTIVEAEEDIAKKIFKDLDRNPDKSWENLTGSVTVKNPKEEDKLLSTSSTENKKSCCAIL